MDIISDSDRLVYKSTLKKDYGFTDRSLRGLGEPDEQVVNPHYKSGPPASLYSLARAMKYKTEHPAEFNGAERLRRKKAAAKAVATKVQKLEEMIDAEPLRQLRPLPKTYRELLSLAWAHACSRYDDPVEPGFNGACSTVRHDFTNYDSILAMIDGKCGSRDAYDNIRRSLDSMVVGIILDAYPELADPSNR